MIELFIQLSQVNLPWHFATAELKESFQDLHLNESIRSKNNFIMVIKEINEHYSNLLAISVESVNNHVYLAKSYHAVTQTNCKNESLWKRQMNDLMIISDVIF